MTQLHDKIGEKYHSSTKIANNKLTGQKGEVLVFYYKDSLSSEFLPTHPKFMFGVTLSLKSKKVQTFPLSITCNLEFYKHNTYL